MMVKTPHTIVADAAVATLCWPFEIFSAVFGVSASVTRPRFLIKAALLFNFANLYLFWVEFKKLFICSGKIMNINNSGIGDGG